MVDRAFRNMHLAVFVLIVVLSGCASGGAASPSAGGGVDLDAALAEARDVEQGESPRDTPDTDAAGDHLDAGTDADNPTEARPHYLLALTSAQAAIAEDARNPLGHRLAAIASLFLGDFQASGEYFNRAEELRPVYEFEDVGMREQAYIDQYQLSSPLLAEGSYEQAAVYLENAAAIYSARPEANITLAQIYAALRDHDQALQKIEDVEALLSSAAIEDVEEETAANWRSQTVGFPLMRAQILADAGRFEDAAAEYRGLVAADPEDIELQQDLAAILGQMGDTQGSVEVYARLLSRPGLNSDGLSRIGMGFYQAQEYGQAAAALERAAEISPMDRDALEWWVRSLMADTAFVEIPPIASRWLELDPQSQQALAILATAHNSNGDAQGAASAIQQVSALEFSVDNLQMRRDPSGGAEVSGGVSNKTLAPGAQVTLVFTFYAESGNRLGTATHTVTVGSQGMSEVFQLRFDSADLVGGYGYTVGG
jgi:tetratricopeptide (TPR) repeat protein